MNTHLKKLLWTGVAMAMAGAAQAAPITTWTVDVDTVFLENTIVANPGLPGVTFVSDYELQWGAPATDAGDSGLLIGVGAALPPVETKVDTNGPIVPNVDITHRNNPIFANTGSLLEVVIASTLTLTPFDPAGLGFPPQTIEFLVNFFETPNDPPGGICADGTLNGEGLNINGCADIFVIDQNSINFNFKYPDIGGDTPGFERDYFISFIEVTEGLKPLPAAACNAVAGVTAPCLGFRTPEEDTTTFQFGALITTDPVSFIPEPGTLALLGLGLGALGLGLRRRRSHIEA